MVAPITSAVRLRVYVDLDFVGAGTGIVLLDQGQANMPGYGQGPSSGAAGLAQTMRKQAGEVVLGNGGAITLAEIDTALKAAADDIAGATGTPFISAADLATINGWATGNP